MDFDIEVFLPSDKDLIERFGLGPDGKTQHVIDTSFISHMREKMPFDNGIMIANTRNPRGGEVTVETPYAHYQNEGILYVNPEHNSPGFPVYEDGVLVDYKGYRGKRVPSDKKLKNYYGENGGPGRGAHFVERTINGDKEEILREAQKEVNKL